MKTGYRECRLVNILSDELEGCYSNPIINQPNNPWNSPNDQVDYHPPASFPPCSLQAQSASPQS